ncbi:MAG TPA: hypothetical protein PKA42_01385 [Candidatus Paceibacterota bacterium]|nr:hypothetical protein [Candidatus Paceibacterota bacterium]HMO82796.1 hypothetical protein [Candidatus Paceibacterota bacterium]
MYPTKYRLELSTVLKVLGIVLLLCLITFYVTFQARFLITGPQIVLYDEPATHQNERVVTLTGKAFNITHLWLNGRQIFTDVNGNFEEALVLENSYTITTLQAKDRYGRETKVVRLFAYTPTSIITN